MSYPESEMPAPQSDSGGRSGPEPPPPVMTVEPIKKALHMGFQAGTSGALAMTIQVRKRSIEVLITIGLQNPESIHGLK